METTAQEMADQAPTQTTQGGNIVGKGPTQHTLYQPPAFMGKSGQPDNRSTNRPKGAT